MWWKLSNYYCNHLKSSWGRPSQPEKEGKACQGERDVLGILKVKWLWKSWSTWCWLCWRWWWWRQWWWWCWRQSWFTIHANLLKHADCIIINCHGQGFLFLFLQVFAYQFFLYFSVISFGFLGNGPRHITYIRNIACECATEHLTTQHVRFVPEFHLYFKVFPIILCCEASIIKHGLISNLIEGMKWHLCLDFYRISVYLINIY